MLRTCKYFKEYKNYLYNLDNYDNIIYQMYNSEYITYKKYLEKNNDDDYSLIVKNTMNQSLYICPNCKDLLYEHEVGAKNGNYLYIRKYYILFVYFYINLRFTRYIKF